MDQMVIPHFSLQPPKGSINLRV